jgi:hypothetical protein
LFVRIVALSTCLVLVAALGPAFGLPLPVGRAQVSSTMGIDVDTTGNSATSLGNIDVCASVATGQTLDVDVYVTDVANVAAWQANMIYDPAILRVTGVNVDLFAGATEQARTLSLSDSVPDQDGSFVLAAVDATPDAQGHTGSGVLARLTLEAVASGTSFLSLDGIILGDPSANPIGDITGDEHFDGAVGSAQVWVDQPCPSELPTPSPTPSPTPTIEAPTSTAVAATTVPGQPSPQATQSVSTTGDNGFPWAIVIGAGVATVVVALAGGLLLRWLLQRTG